MASSDNLFKYNKLQRLLSRDCDWGLAANILRISKNSRPTLFFYNKAQDECTVRTKVLLRGWRSPETAFSWFRKLSSSIETINMFRFAFHTIKTCWSHMNNVINSYTPKTGGRAYLRLLIWCGTAFRGWHLQWKTRIDSSCHQTLFRYETYNHVWLAHLSPGPKMVWTYKPYSGFKGNDIERLELLRIGMVWLGFGRHGLLLCFCCLARDRKDIEFNG